jgi:hypothetical protein
MSEHKAEVIDVQVAGDGHLAVKIRCCGDEQTDSVLTIVELQRADEEVDADIAAHVARVEKLHAAVTHHAQRHMERLKKR